MMYIYKETNTILLDRSMKSLLTTFVSLSFKMLWIKDIKQPIDQFYTNNICSKFGFTDVKGNVWQYNLTTESCEKIISNCFNLKEYKAINNNYSLLDYYSKDTMSISTSIINEKHIRKFDWRDSTLYHTIHDDVYYRYNHFGDVYVKILKDETKKPYTLKLNSFFSKYEYLQKVCTIEDYIFVINNSNIVKVFKYKEGKIRLLYSMALVSSTIVKKLQIKKYGNFFQLCILYHNQNRIDLITLHYINDTKEMQFYNKNCINVRCPEDPIIDCDFISNVVCIFKRNRLIIYAYNPYRIESQEICNRTINFPYFTEVIWINNKLLLNNQAGGIIPYVAINSDFNSMLNKTSIIKIEK